MKKLNEILLKQAISIITSWTGQLEQSGNPDFGKTKRKIS